MTDRPRLAGEGNNRHFSGAPNRQRIAPLSRDRNGLWEGRGRGREGSWVPGQRRAKAASGASGSRRRGKLRLAHLWTSHKRARADPLANRQCGPPRGAGARAEGSLSAAAALFSQSENIPEVSPRGAAAAPLPCATAPPPAGHWRPGAAWPPAAHNRVPARSPGSALPVWTRTSLGQPLPLLGGGICPAPLRSPPAPPLRTRFPAPLPPSPGRAALGLCLYLTKTVSRGRWALAARWRAAA